jgi:glycine/D-amino acid oxidase-like deaminating enzyme
MRPRHTPSGTQGRAAPRPARRRLRVAVIGAGAFGGWTALTLARRGADVTLVDAWGPGHARASSGGETRVIRATYGDRERYAQMAIDALRLWQAHDRAYRTRFFVKTGVLWMAGRDAGFLQASAAVLRAAGQPFDEPTVGEARRRYPQIRFTGVRSVLVERNAGYLLARRACEHVAACLVSRGGVYRQAAVRTPVPVGDRRLDRLVLSDGGPPLRADAFVFACGPWLGALFPDVIGPRITPTRQEVFYFGTPAGDPRFRDEALPVWMELADRAVYGIPGNAHRGFKVADDTSGPLFDPTNGDRAVTPARLRIVRDYLAVRFPALARAPLIGAEVCQYEASPDTGFILDRHPAASNVWIAGGGSGHGFKMGPVVGTLMASFVLETRDPDPAFGLARLAAVGRGAGAKWTVSRAGRAARPTASAR